MSRLSRLVDTLAMSRKNRIHGVGSYNFATVNFIDSQFLLASPVLKLAFCLLLWIRRWALRLGLLRLLFPNMFLESTMTQMHWWRLLATLWSIVFP